MTSNESTDLELNSASGVRRFRWMGVLAFVVIASGMSIWGWKQYERSLETRRVELRAECRKAMRLRKWDRLEELAASWLRWDQNNGFAWLFLAEAAQQKGDVNRTARCLGMIQDTDPKAVPALVEKAMLEFGVANNPLEAELTCRRILRLAPRNALAHQRLIFFYAMTLQREKLLNQIREARSLGCENKEAYVYLMLADELAFTNGPQWNSRWLSSSPDADVFQVAKAVHLAETAYAFSISKPTSENNQRSSEMEREVHQLMERFPQNPVLLTYLLHRAAEAGEVERAGEILDRFGQQHEQSHQVWTYRGWHLAAIGELEQADEAYKRALSIYPLSIKTHHLYAAVLRRLKRFSAAEEMQKLVLVGKELSKLLMELPNTESVTPELLKRIAEYARSCGDELTSQDIQRHLLTSESTLISPQGVMTREPLTSGSRISDD